MNSVYLTTVIMAYQPALMALALLSLCVLIQSSLTAPLAFLKNEQSPGMPLNGDHRLLSFRVLRTHANSVESLTPFAAAVGLSIAFETNSTAVNWLAISHVIFRLCFWAIYYSGIGKIAGGMRTLCFVGGLISNMALLVLIIASVYLA